MTANETAALALICALLAPAAMALVGFAVTRKPRNKYTRKGK